MVRSSPEMKNAGEAMALVRRYQEIRSSAASWRTVYGIVPSEFV
jgi:hypothetical protein